MDNGPGQDTSERIAVIGMAGRFPGARDVETFWRNLCNGVESITFFTAEELLAEGVEPALLDDPGYVRANGLLDDVERFDADFFGVPPREAELTDPQHRLFLECAWTALERSGYDPETCTARIGVYAGTGLSSYLLHLLLTRPEAIRPVNQVQLLMGNNKDYMPTRVSYKLNLKGPSVNVSTACSTSLVAVHLAVQSLLDYHCDIALAGGSSVLVPQRQGYRYEEGGIASPDGHCRAFDAAAQGTVSGSGVGIVVLRRLEDALAAGDHIHAVIAGSAVNNDGAAKVGYTAPSLSGQAEVIAEAQGLAGFSPDSITYIETHGTGTALGDPIEIAALSQVFRAGTARRGFCAIGSVKTNLGHLDEAAGVAGLIKTVLALEHGLIPPSLHFREPNPQIDFAASPFFVNTRLREWKTDGVPRRAGVSSFGIGGTNAHVVLEEAPPRPASGKSRPYQLLLLSARTQSALEQTGAQLAAWLREHPQVNLADVAYTLHLGRRAFRERRMLACADAAEAVAALAGPDVHKPGAAAAPSRQRSVAFLFSGQGSQYPGMGLELYRTEPVFRDWIDRCADLLQPQLGLDLRRVLYPQEPSAAAEQALQQTALTQPALFAVEYALAQLWLSWGIRPQAMLGHSLGEYVAACLAGVLDLEDALALVAARGRLIQRLPGGAMLAVPLPEAEVQGLLGRELSLAAVNGPALCVVSGPGEAVQGLQERLAERGVEGVRLHTSHAFHSAMLEPVLAPFLEAFRTIQLKPPRLPYLSNLTGTWIRPDEATDPAYWVRHLRRTVRFEEGLRELLKEPGRILLEVGPGRTLAALAGPHPQRSAEQLVLTSLRHPRQPGSDSAFLLNTLGDLWLAGVKVDWAGFYAHEQRRRLPLPTYPFEGRRYWIEAPAPSAPPPHPGPLPRRENPEDLAEPAADRLADWFYVPVWQRTALEHAAEMPGRWLLFMDAQGLGERLAMRLRRAGHDVIGVRSGSSFARLDSDTYTLQPGRRADYETLLENLTAARRRPQAIVHLWSVTPPRELNLEILDQAAETGFYSLLWLVQALGMHEGALPIIVVSANLHPVTGHAAEALCPGNALLTGPVRVIPQEYPQLRCRHVDLALPAAVDEAELDRLADQLLAECAAESSPPLVAWRGAERWVRTLEPRCWPAASGLPGRLRQGGVYLITGGLGSMGLAFADYLARRVEARLVLVGRELPPRDEWACIERLEADLERNLAIPGLEAYPGLEERLKAYCTGLIGAYLKACHVPLERGRRYDREDWRARLKILPGFARFFDFFLEVLAEDGFIALYDGMIECLNPALPDPIAIREALNAGYPQFRGLTELLAHCAGHYPAALSGAMEAIHVLYPDGTSRLLDDSGRETAEYASDRLYMTLAARLIAGLADSGKKLRILEIGAGTGTLTYQVLEALGAQPGKHRNVEYHFTDIGQAFLLKARQEAAQRGLDFIRCSLFDITQDPEPQGYALNSFDIILGYNVVHATPRIAATLDNLNRLLRPGGLLLLVETVQALRWNDMIWGLAEGWWCFEDRELRTRSPLLTLEQWERVLRERGFADVTGYPRAPARRGRSAGGLLIARRPGGSDPDLAVGLDERQRSRMRRLQALEAAGTEVLALEADVADRAQMEAVAAQIRERFGELDGVIHTAGLLGQGIIHTKTREQTEPVLAPKVRGTWILAESVRDFKPDFFVLCSSLSALSPIIGQVDYCAANAFLDAFAHYQTQRGTSTVSIDWGFWQELGMIEAAGVSPAARQAFAQDIRRKGLSGAGVDALERILYHCTVPQVIVSPSAVRDAPADGRTARQLYRPVEHPLLESRLEESNDQVAYVTRLSTRRHWVIDEHRVLGQAVLPGTAYLELARAAFARHTGAAALELQEVYFLSPLILADGEEREVRTILKRQADGFAFFIVSRLGEDRWQEHARGEVHSLKAPLPAGQSIETLKAACDREERRLIEPASGFGPRWNNVRWVRFGAREGLARLELPPDFAAEVQDYALHPALLDMATGFMTLRDSLARGLPFFYRRLRVGGPLPAAVYSHARRVDAPSGMLAFDVTVLDGQGRELVVAEGYTLREAAGAAADAPSDDPAARRWDNLCLEVIAPGALDSLIFRPTARRPPGPGEVEIRILAAGLNFIEVLYALGMLPKVPELGRVRFGLECAGRIAAVGEGVEGFQVGDEVIAYAPGCFALYTTTKAAAVAHKPAALTPEQAATLPAVFSTAYYALIIQGRLQRGERVLIHAAAGGLGLAAVQIARWLGAEIFATASSEEKRAYLRSLGIRHIWNSRTLEFADGILEATGGKGIDVVLNSLGGEFIAKSLEVLAPYGRFLEVGKRDLFKNAQLSLRPFLKSLTFTVIDVGPEMPGFGAVWSQITERFAAGDFKPLPYTLFPLTEAAQAFETMAQARHTGKIVLAVEDSEALWNRAAAQEAGLPLSAIIGTQEPESGPEPAPASPAEAAGPALAAQPIPILPPSAHRRPELETPFAAPRSATEAGVAAIWQQLLGIDPVGIHDNFFELRGDSLLAAQVVSRIHKTFQVKLPLSSLFENPTVAALAERVDRLRGAQPAPATALGDNEEEGEI